MKVHFLEVEPSEQDYFLEQLGAEHELVFDDCPEEVSADAEALSCFIYSTISRSFVRNHPALRLVVTRSTTHDHIDLCACKEAGITVCTVGSYGDFTVAEHTFALILALSRRLRLMMNARERFSYETLRATELRGKTLGILGMGRIGKQMVPIAKAFGMKVIACDPKEDRDSARRLRFKYVSFKELLERSDVLSLHACLDSTTYHILDKEALGLCKKGVLLVNTSRGALISTEALLEALKAGVVGGVGLDVLEDETVMRKEALNVISEQIIERVHHGLEPEEPRGRETRRIKQLEELVRNKELLARQDVVFTPHVAFNSNEAIERINRTTVENIRAFLAGAPRELCTSA